MIDDLCSCGWTECASALANDQAEFVDLGREQMEDRRAPSEGARRAGYTRTR